jgi:hypothetical protein
MDNRERDREPEDDDRMDLESPLGLAGEAVPKDDRIRASNDEESVRRRRARAGIGHQVEERRSTGLGDLKSDPDGASGVDMGYGGEGTDVKTSR